MPGRDHGQLLDVTLVELPAAQRATIGWQIECNQLQVP
jgi:hypothetical protein